MIIKKNKNSNFLCTCNDENITKMENAIFYLKNFFKKQFVLKLYSNFLKKSVNFTQTSIWIDVKISN